MAFDVLTMGRIGVDISPLQIRVSLREVRSFGRVADGLVRGPPPPVSATSAVGLSECSLPAGMRIIRYAMKEGHRGP
jgi:hypothetical protein